MEIADSSILFGGESTPDQFEGVSPTVLTSNRKHFPSYAFPPLPTTQFGSVSPNVLTRNRKLKASYAPTLLPNGIDTENRPIAGVDWSRHTVYVYEPGKPVAEFATLAEATLQYTGYIWAIESTADSYELQNRQVDLDAIKAADIRAYCFNPKYTARYRLKWDDIPKTDEADAEVIYRVFTEAKLSCHPFRTLKTEDKIREEINQSIIKDRFQFDGATAIQTAKEFLPTFQDIPIKWREFLYDAASIKPKNPKNPIPRKQIGRFLMTAVAVRKSGYGWRTLRRLVGNYGLGYGNILRSEYYHWLVRTVFNARLKQAGITKQTKNSHVDPKTKEEKLVRIWSPEELKMNKEVMRETGLILKWLWNLTSLKA